MLKKRIIAAGVAAMLTTPAFAGSLGDLSLDGLALFEFWQDSNQGPTSDSYADNQVFTLHELGFGSTKSIGGGNRVVWHLFTRIQNGARQIGDTAPCVTNNTTIPIFDGAGNPVDLVNNTTGAPGADGLADLQSVATPSTCGVSGKADAIQRWGNREAWVGFEGDSWGQIAFGRFLTKGFTLINWPYSCDAGTCEINAETGGHALTVGQAIRYQTPSLGMFNGEVLWGIGASSAAGRPDYWEFSGHIETKPVKIDFIYTDIKNAGMLGPNSVYDQAGFVDGTEQTELFLGARVPMGSGVEGVFGYFRNTYHVDAGLGGSLWWNSWGSAAEEVSQDRVFIQGKFAFGKDLLGIGVTKFLQSSASEGADPDDAGTVIGAKYSRMFVPGAFAYVFVRHYSLDGEIHPITAAPWQYGNMGMPWWGLDNTDDAVVRLGFGGGLLF